MLIFLFGVPRHSSRGPKANATATVVPPLAKEWWRGGGKNMQSVSDNEHVHSGAEVKKCLDKGKS